MTCEACIVKDGLDRLTGLGIILPLRIKRNETTTLENAIRTVADIGRFIQKNDLVTQMLTRTRCNNKQTGLFLSTNLFFPDGITDVK